MSVFVVDLNRTVSDVLVDYHPHTQDTQISQLLFIVKSAVTLLNIFHCVILLHEEEKTDGGKSEWCSVILEKLSKATYRTTIICGLFQG